MRKTREKKWRKHTSSNCFRSSLCLDFIDINACYAVFRTTFCDFSHSWFVHQREIPSLWLMKRVSVHVPVGHSFNGNSLILFIFGIIQTVANFTLLFQRFGNPDRPIFLQSPNMKLVCIQTTVWYRFKSMVLCTYGCEFRFVNCSTIASVQWCNLYE